MVAACILTSVLLMLILCKLRKGFSKSAFIDTDFILFLFPFPFASYEGKG